MILASLPIYFFVNVEYVESSIIRSDGQNLRSRTAPSPLLAAV